MLYRFEEVWKSFGAHDILNGATWQHNPGEKVGFIGRNGAGKTTLLDILIGREVPDRGKIFRMTGLRLGYLTQDADAPPGISLRDFTVSGRADLQEVERQLRVVEQDLSEDDPHRHDELLGRYQALHEVWERGDGYGLPARAEKMLAGVGLAEEHWDRPLARLSGGQKNRAMLARLLLADADILLLDEPTNHLDIDGILFLEAQLAEWRGAFLLVSHDRAFLNKLVGRMVEIEHGELKSYPGNYDRYRRQKDEQVEAKRRAYDEQQVYIDKTQSFIRKNLAGQKTKQAKSRRTQLENLDRLEAPRADTTEIAFHFDPAQRSGDHVLVLEALTAGYPGKPLVAKIDALVRRGDRIALVGPNGSGKTTLMKTLEGRLTALSGSYRYGVKVSPGYYDQELADLRPGKRVIDEIWDLDTRQSELGVRNYLGRYAFYDDDVFKTTDVLSGGERGRLSLARVIYRRHNLLLLDEPTNHLDVYAREALEEALGEYTGTLLVISHDRYFLDRVVDTLWVIEDGELAIERTTYSEWLRRRGGESRHVFAPAAAIDPVPAAKKEMAARARHQTEAERTAAKKAEREERKLAQKRSRLEADIAARETRQEELKLLLCAPEVYADGEKVREISSEQVRLRDDLAGLYREWEGL